MTAVARRAAPDVDPGWAPRPLLSLGVRFVQYGVPLAVGLLGSRLLGHLLHPVLSGWTAAMVVLLASVVLSLLASRLTMRLGPLALLLKMTMIFPDRAPSRLKVARRSTSVHEIRQRLATGAPDEQEAAVTMLALVTALAKHDKHTRGHSERVRLFCDLLAKEPRPHRGGRRPAALVGARARHRQGSRSLPPC
ncbi:hypothetical protein GCM10025868_17310 [Angustibacter aerolatus]|uniref:Uncharacterized protein n=1 Tax=Angustibacter aerolatus TaxID=1162965 RepID=A0ABQ6JI73_9ACTN|nr:hypothetical protein [Angustibacter aerolatus]GMA86481.1 hypothetical protein GCM10025868_17310 [Angustibacter aerolatus]